MRGDPSILIPGSPRTGRAPLRGEPAGRRTADQPAILSARRPPPPAGHILRSEGTVSVRRWLSFRTLLGATLALGLASLSALPAASAAKKEASREDQIAELERQIADLTRRLEELKAATPAPT